MLVFIAIVVTFNIPFVTCGVMHTDLEEFPSKNIFAYYNPFYWLGWVIYSIATLEVKDKEKKR